LDRKCHLSARYGKLNLRIYYTKYGTGRTVWGYSHTVLIWEGTIVTIVSENI